MSDPSDTPIEATADAEPSVPEGTAPATEPAPSGAEEGPVRRVWPGIAVRAAIVLVASAVAYFLVVPVSTVERSRLDLLLAHTNGTKDFPGAPARVVQKPASTADLAALSSDAKAHPASTGIVVEDWQHGSEDGLVSVVLLSSSVARAVTAERELVTQALGTKAYASQGLARKATFTVPGVAGATGATFATTSATDGGSIAIAVARTGRALSLVETVSGSSDPQPDTVTATRVAAAHLGSVEPGFTLSPTRYPTVTTVVWAAVTVALAAAVAAGPPVVGRRRRRRHQEWLDEQARLIRVRGGTVTRTRRGG